MKVILRYTFSQKDVDFTELEEELSKNFDLDISVFFSNSNYLEVVCESTANVSIISVEHACIKYLILNGCEMYQKELIYKS